mgnify:CR=1 FL=1
MEVKATQKQIKYLNYLKRKFADRIRPQVYAKHSHRSEAELRVAREKFEEFEKMGFEGLLKREASRMIDAFLRYERMPVFAVFDCFVNLPLDKLFDM